VLVVALTGGLGAGKSTVGQALAGRGAVVIDTDEVARHVLAPGSSGERTVLDHFGPGVTTPQGRLDRQALARIVFSQPSQRLALEAITHPLIAQEVARRLAAAKEGGAAVAVVEIPLLDAARRHQYGVDIVVMVDAPEGVAVERAVKRGLSADDARARMAAQPTGSQRRALADRVVDNTDGLQELDAHLGELWQWLLQRPEAAEG